MLSSAVHLLRSWYLHKSSRSVRCWDWNGSLGKGSAPHFPNEHAKTGIPAGDQAAQVSSSNRVAWTLLTEGRKAWGCPHYLAKVHSHILSRSTKYRGDGGVQNSNSASAKTCWNREHLHIIRNSDCCLKWPHPRDLPPSRIREIYFLMDGSRKIV